MTPLEDGCVPFECESEPGPTAPRPSNRRLRIAVLNRIFSPTGGGAERYSIALVEQLAQRHELHVFAQRIDHQWPGVTYHIVSSPFTRPRWINQLWYAAATWWKTRRAFDVVHSHESTWHGQVQTVHVLPVKYTLFHGRTGWARAIRVLKVACSPRLLAYLWLERLRFVHIDSRRIVVTSGSLMAQVAHTYPAAHNLQVVTPGVTMAGAPVTQVMRLAARKRLGLPEAGNGILFVGNDYRKKGLAPLVQALRLLPDNAWLVVVGNAVAVPEFRAQAKAAGVLSRMFFLGPLHDVRDAYISADCLAHPTREDTYAMVVLEAMAYGLPVIVSSERYCGISGLLTHEANALILSDPNDSTALASALRRVLQDPLLRQNLSEAAVKFASLHQWSSIAEQQEAIYLAVSRPMA